VVGHLTKITVNPLPSGNHLSRVHMCTHVTKQKKGGENFKKMPLFARANR
jgi:hypothetical protein